MVCPAPFWGCIFVCPSAIDRALCPGCVPVHDAAQWALRPMSHALCLSHAFCAVAQYVMYGALGWRPTAVANRPTQVFFWGGGGQANPSPVPVELTRQPNHTARCGSARPYEDLRVQPSCQPCHATAAAPWRRANALLHAIHTLKPPKQCSTRMCCPGRNTVTNQPCPPHPPPEGLSAADS